VWPAANPRFCIGGGTQKVYAMTAATIDKVKDEEWYRRRRKGIGGSDAAVVLGVSPWKTRVQLWREKRGELPETDISHKEFVYWGIRLEDIIADEYERRMNLRIERTNEIVQSKLYPWMLCNLDGRVIGASVRVIAEIKTVSLFQFVNKDWGDDGTAEIPPYYYSQCQHNMVCDDAVHCDMPVLIGGNDFRVYRIPKDEEYCKMLIRQESDFMECVRTGTPPAPVSPADMALIFPESDPQRSVIASDEVAAAAASFARHRALMKACKQTMDNLQMVMQAHMSDAEFLKFNGETIATWRYSEKLDARRFLVKLKDADNGDVV
jgi:putative phage-type endonuclease